MSAKKGKKEKGKKKGREPPPKEYTLISLEDVRAREMKHISRLVDLRSVLHILDDALLEVENLQERRTIQEKWEGYLRCDGIPKPYSPPDIRRFFVKMRFFEAKNVEKNIDWLLSVNERSILSQDIFRKDFTRKTLVHQIRPNFGTEYDTNVDLGLQVLKDISYYLDDDKMVVKASDRILLDIKEQKTVVQQEIMQLFDRFAYRILCSEEAYMEQIDAITTEYWYQGNNFEMHIWSLKNVPILFDFYETPSMMANLHQLKIELELPFCVLEENLTIRALHFNFDHFSEHAKSFEQIPNVPVDNLNAGIPDLHDCLLNEWTMQVNIQTEVRNKMIQQRIDFEEKLKFLEEEEARKAKERKGGGKDKGKKPDKKKKNDKGPKKGPKEPPIITPDTFPDVWEDFLSAEHKQFEEFLTTVYHPDVLKLTENEINMKKYLILGGVYQIYIVSKPTHVDYSTFTMTWHANNGNLYIDKDVVAKEFKEKYNMRSSSFHHEEMRRKSTKEDSRKSLANEETSHYFIITFELPQYLCLWGEPMACHFEADLTGVIEAVENEISPNVVTRLSSKTPPASVAGQTVSDSVSMVSTHISATTKENNELRSTTNIFRPSLSQLSVFKSTTSSKHNLRIDNFDLNFPLTRTQIRNLQRHCMPRLLSTFKFPIELLEEENEESAGKSKGQGGTLVRKRASGDTPEEAKASEHVFSVSNQNNPERLFPVFLKSESLQMPYFNANEMATVLGKFEPETFYELIDALDWIKNVYTSKYNEIMDVPRLQIIKKSNQSRHSIPLDVEDLDDKNVRKSIQNQPKRKPLKEQADRRKLKSRKGPVDDKARDDEDGTEKSLQTYKFSHWTKEHIFHSEYDKENCKLTIWTDRLGTIGFAYKRYEHFPFRFWSVEPSEERPEQEIVFTLETQYAKCVIFVTAEGYRGYVTDLIKKYVRNRVIYLEIKEPLKDLKELKKRFRDKNLNIFSDHDACFYIENGYFSEKHLATELHSYNCMAIHGFLMKFMFSSWNRLAKRRDIVLRFSHNKEPEENMMLARISPEESSFVEIRELCSDNLEVFNLEYTLTWRNIDFYADLHHLITSVYPSATDMRVKDPNLIYCLKNLLWEIRPLSFS